MGEALAWLSSSFKVTNCCHEGCGVAIAMPSNVYDSRRKDHQLFYCCHGHSQYFGGKSEADKLRDQLAVKQRELEWAQQGRESWRKAAKTAEHSANAYKGKLGSIKRRIASGVCPCCTRSFQNLRRHMETKHPEYKKDAE